MATNNAINLSGTGIVSYDGSGAFTALANPLTVPNGGSGAATYTSYGVMCGGTTSTAALQNISAGSTRQILTSAGAGVLPSFSASSITPIGRYITISTTTGNPADGVTYYLNQGGSITGSTSSSLSGTRIYLTQSGEIDAAYGIIRVAGTLGSNQNTTLNVRKNDTTNYAISTTLQLNTANRTFNNTSNFGSFAEGDYIDVTMVCPTWTTNPTTVSVSVTLWFTNS